MTLLGARYAMQQRLHTTLYGAIYRVVVQRLQETPQHPNVVWYLDEFVELDHLYLVIEYCPGGDLYEFARQQPGQHLTCAGTLGVIAQVAADIAFLHAQGIAHRGVSLENVFLGDSGVCKLGDFGLTVDADYPYRGRVRKAYYMASEVGTAATTSDNYSYDARAADVWSLGILMFILVLGSPLVSDATPGKKSAFAAIANSGVRKILDAWEPSETV